MDKPTDTRTPAPAARTAFNTIVDQLGYSVNDMRMFASLMDTIAQAKLAREGDSSPWLRPGIEGTYLASIEAEEICFLALQVERMARKLDEQFDILTEALSAREGRAA